MLTPQEALDFILSRVEAKSNPAPPPDPATARPRIQLTPGEIDAAGNLINAVGDATTKSCPVVGTVLKTLAEILAIFNFGKSVTLQSINPAFSAQNGPIDIQDAQHAKKLATQTIFKVIAN